MTTAVQQSSPQPVQNKVQYSVDTYVDEEYVATVDIPAEIGINTCSDALLMEVWKML